MYVHVAIYLILLVVGYYDCNFDFIYPTLQPSKYRYWLFTGQMGEIGFTRWSDKELQITQLN